MSARSTSLPVPTGRVRRPYLEEFLPQEAACPVFINADLIAAGLSPFRPEVATVRAGRIMLEQINDHVRRGESFAFETTLSGRGYARLIPSWQERGYRVKLMFLRLPTPELAIAQVRLRVKEGGHDVPEDVIRRRFVAGYRNLESLYRRLVDEWAVYDNSERVPVLVAQGPNDEPPG